MYEKRGCADKEIYYIIIIHRKFKAVLSEYLLSDQQDTWKGKKTTYLYVL